MCWFRVNGSVYGAAAQDESAGEKEILKFRTPDIAQKSFQYTSFSRWGANLKLSAFCVCNDRFMIRGSTKSERKTGCSFLLQISLELQLAWFFASPGCELKTVRFFNQ